MSASSRPMGRKAAAVLLLLALVAGACGGGGETARGIVVEVQGDLEEVRSFTVRTADGRTLELVPAPGLRFHDGPLSHLRQHMVGGEPVVVRYVSREGTLVAVEVRDA